MPKKKLYMIGIDSAALWLVKELARGGKLPGLGTLMEKGMLTELESAMPPMTGPAWPSIYTGLNPAEHGVPDFFEMKKDYTPELAFYDSEKSPPFWKELANKGYRCLLITPATEINLPKYKNVDIITGFPLKAKTNSEYLATLMKKEHFEGEPDVEKDMKAGKMSVEEGTQHFVRSIRSRTTIAEKAIEHGEYDFIYVCFTETDRLQHFVMNKKNMTDYTYPIYKEIDNLITFCTRRADKEGSAVIVVSDHGVQPIKEKLLLNTWMIKNKFATLKESVIESISSNSEKTPTSYALREKVMKTDLRKVYDKLPHSAKKAVHASVGSLFSAASTGEYTRLHLFDYEMAKTLAFAGISNINVATIFINDERFDRPTVKKSDFAALKKKLIQQLGQIKDEHGKVVVEGAYDAAAYYGTRPKFIAPDIFVEAKPGYTIDIFNFSRSGIFMEPEPPKRGDHTRMGIFGAYPKTKLNLPKKNLTVTDIAPIIRSYFD